MAMQDEIERLSASLYLHGDFRAIVSRRLINTMLAEISAAHDVDLDIHLKQGRIRSEEVNVVVNVKNYTDVDGGDGHADLTRLSIENIADGKTTLRLAGNGEVDARLRGREFGVAYSVSPHLTFSIDEQSLPMEFGSEGKKIFMRAAPGATLPIDLQFNLKLGGHDVRLNRRSVAQADKWLKRVELPSFFDREISLPRKILIDSGGHPHIMDSQKLEYMLSNMRIEAKDDSLEITADVKINQPTIPSMMNPPQWSDH